VSAQPKHATRSDLCWYIDLSCWLIAVLKFVWNEVTFFSHTEYCKSVIHTLTLLSFSLSYCLSTLNAVYFFCFLSLKLTNTHTGSFYASLYTSSRFLFISFFIYFYIHFSSPYTVTAAILPDWLFHLSFCLNTPSFSFCLPPSFSFLTLFFSLSFCLLLSFSLSLPTPLPHSLSLCCTLSLTQLLLVSHPPLPLPLPLLSLFLSSPSFFISLYLSFLTPLPHSISHPPVPLLPLSSFFHWLPQSPLFPHSLTLFSVCFSLPLSDCFKSSNYKWHGYQGIQVPLLISPSLSLSLSLSPPPHTSCFLSSVLQLSVSSSLFPLCLLKLKFVFMAFNSAQIKVPAR